MAGFPGKPSPKNRSHKGLAALIIVAAAVLMAGGLSAGYLHHRAALAADITADAHTTVRTPAHAGGLTQVDNPGDAPLHQQIAESGVFAHVRSAAYRAPGVEDSVKVWEGMLASPGPGSLEGNSVAFFGIVANMHDVNAPESIGGAMRCGDVRRHGVQGGATAMCVWGNRYAAVAFMTTGSGDLLAVTAAAMLPDLVRRA